MIPPPLSQRHEPLDTWLERSLQHPVYFDRSPGEKAAEARLIREKAKTEWWNRSLSKFLFATGVAVPSLIMGAVFGMLIGLRLS